MWRGLCVYGKVYSNLKEHRSFHIHKVAHPIRPLPVTNIPKSTKNISLCDKRKLMQFFTNIYFAIEFRPWTSSSSPTSWMPSSPAPPPSTCPAAPPPTATRTPPCRSSTCWTRQSGRISWGGIHIWRPHLVGVECRALFVTLTLSWFILTDLEPLSRSRLIQLLDLF